MVALVAAPVLEERFDKQGALWTPDDLDKQLGTYFADRDPAVGFAADSIMKLSAQCPTAPPPAGSPARSPS